MKWRVLNYNVMIPVPQPIRYYGQKERASRVFDVVNRYQDLDVLVLNEVIPPKIRKIIHEAGEQAGFVHRTDTMSHWATLVSSGLFIMSPHPIVEEDSVRFGNACSGSDCLSSKGVVYAKIDKNGSPLHVFATHAQAWPGISREHVRRDQLDILNTFIVSKQIPGDEPVVLMGDLNMDMYSEKSQLRQALHTLSFKMPRIHEKSHKYTVDSDNNVLVGADDPGMYKSQKFPEGCVEQYFKTLKCPCCPSVWLDYVLYSTKHLRPVSSYIRSDVVKVKPFACKLNDGEHEIGDVSDHYPVYAELEFDRSKNVGTGGQATRIVHPSDSFMNTVGSLIVLVFLSFMSFLIYVAKTSVAARGILAATPLAALAMVRE
jgi:endonuclease/exonuclease/phosphatase family metal-dependent hydrolase